MPEHEIARVGETGWGLERWMALAGAAALVLIGCEQGRTPDPPLAGRARGPVAPVPQASAEPDVVDRVHGVEVVIDPRWTGNVEVRRRVTPVGITIRNAGSELVGVRYEALALVSGQGHRYAALPPFALEGPLEKPKVVGEHRFDPRIETADYLVAPYCERVYSGMPAYSAPFTYDPLYFRLYHAEWEAIRLPRAELIERAIPEGVIRPGGSVSGFFYFQLVEPLESRLTFQMTLANPETGRRFGALSIPLDFHAPT